MSTQSKDQPVQQVAQLVKDATEVDMLTVVRSTINAVLAPLASLKLTVFLLSLATFVIWVITLEQARADFWTIKNKHFPDLFVYVQFQILFPPKWFPQLQEIPGGFYMPSGTLILVMMLANLLAAHLIRMRVQATGRRLGLGIAAIVIGIIFVWAVVFFSPALGGHKSSVEFYQGMWILMQLGLLGLVVTSIVSIFLVDSHRKVERTLLGAFAATMLGVVIFVFVMGEESFIGHSAMRILWQLIQSTIAALILLAGCILVFNRKGGMVLIHFGIGMLMFNELYVTMTNVEQQMTLAEGESSSVTQDIRSTELMVLHENDEGKHEIVTLPRDEFLQDKVVSHSTLPFDIECVVYFPNSELEKVFLSSDNVATRGYGLFKTPRELAVSNGAGANQTVDIAAGYFKLTDKKTGKPIGVHMLSQESYAAGIYDQFEIDGETYHLGLRFKTFYKPYTVELTDVQRDLYVGTETPKWFSSDFKLVDHNLGQTSKQRIWMNNPLRHANETFYQSGYGSRGDTEFSTFQIVKNSGWMIPYVACMIVVVGLVAQFGATLLKFLEKSQAANLAVSATNLSKKPVVEAELVDLGPKIAPKKKTRKAWPWATLAVVALVTIWVVGQASKASRATVVKDKMRIDLWGQMPVTHKGRIQPLESVARNLVLQLSNREEVRYPVDKDGNELGSVEKLGDAESEGSNSSEGSELVAAEPIVDDESTSYDGAAAEVEEEETVPTAKRPAVRWVADMVYETNGYEDVQILRIEDLNVAAALGLPKHRQGLKYTLAELEEVREEMGRLLKEAEQNRTSLKTITDILKRNPQVEDAEIAQMLGLKVERVNELRKLDPNEPYTPLQVRLQEVQAKLNKVYGLRLALQNTFVREGDVVRGLHSAALMKTSKVVPRSVYLGGEEWIPYSLAGCRIWLSKFAEKHGVVDVDKLTRELAHNEMGVPSQAELLYEEILRSPEFQQMIEEEGMPQTLDEFKQLFVKGGDKTKAISAKAASDAKQKIETFFKENPAEFQRRAFLENQISEMLEEINGSQQTLQSFESEDYGRLSALEFAYKQGDAETFNSTLETYLADVESSPPLGMRLSAMKAEKFYNFFSPFYIATVIYLAAIFFTLIGWTGLPSMTRASFGLVGVALAVHVLGLVLRVVISGRPPVTNLYSSFLFVSAGSVAAMMVVERMTKLGIGNMLAGVMGASALLWAWSIAIGSGDTFAVLLAVLDTQFWLSTHVICISLGYSATVAAGLVGIAFLLGSLLVPVFDKGTRKTFSTIIYGIVCFALLLSFFGTVLGGLWGDDSWGRFWGWDPKENGALMIVFWNAIVLHARWGGMIKDRGLAGLSVLGIVVTLWSWEGVNQLGVGLHTYGFNEGKLIRVMGIAAGMMFIASLALIPKKVWPSVKRENG